MPVMMRPSKKARKIAFSILGNPQALKDTKQQYVSKKKNEEVIGNQPLLVPRMIG